MSEQNKHKRPKYTLEFKKDAAKLVNEKGYTHNRAVFPKLKARATEL
jgi:transposase